MLVLQFDPPLHGDEGGAGSQFERVLSLSRFLCSREMASVKTVAFLPRSVRGHATLLALACEEIVMAPETTLGEAGVDEHGEGAMSPTVIGAYREIAETRRTMPVALAVGMIDAGAEVLQLETEQGTEFILRSDFTRPGGQREVIGQRVLVPAGTLASYTGREGRQFGFVKFLSADRTGLAQALRVPLTAIHEEDTLAGEWRPILIDVQGPITPLLANRIETMLTTALEQNINWIGLRIDSSGGDLAASLRIASTLAALDPNSVRTIAYVPVEAKGGSALIALSCDQLFMHSDARLGTAVVPNAAEGPVDKGPVDKGSDDKGPDDKKPGEAPGLGDPRVPSETEAAKTMIRESLAPRAERSWSLLSAMIDPDIKLFSYHNKITGETRQMSADEAAMLTKPEDWQAGKPLAKAGQALVIEGEQAAQFGLVRQTVESFDDLKKVFRLTEDPPVAKPNWALELIEGLASPGFAVILLMAGFAGIYIEMRTPGIGIGAFVGAVAIMLFFWSQYLNGTAGWLEVLLFVAGIGCILLEIFVLPGFGIFGLGGGAMVIASLVLASLTFIRPHSAADMDALANSVSMLAVAGAGMIACVLVSRRYLSEAPRCYAKSFWLE